MKLQIMDTSVLTNYDSRRTNFATHDKLRKILLMNDDPELFQLYHDIFIAPTQKYSVRKEELLRLYVLCGHKQGEKELEKYFS